MTSPPPLSKGGCPCINSTAVLASLAGRQCLLSPSGDAGVRITLGGSCVPFSYGSTMCLQHDLLHDATCRVGLPADGNIIPPHCFRPWCYVDEAACRKYSGERVFRSSYFSFDSGLDLYYSYSACNSTADDWLEAKNSVVGSSEAFGGVSLDANIATYVQPMMFKRDADGNILTSTGSEYYDDRIPFEGVYLNYFRQIMKFSNGDIKQVNNTHVSKSSYLMHPTSSFTAAVQDISDGLVDLSVGPFWVTPQRLKMSAFTIPIVNDKTYLVIPKPKRDNLMFQVQKVWKPFQYELWGIIFGVIFVTALLTVWFRDEPSMSNQSRSNNSRRIPQTGRQAGRQTGRQTGRQSGQAPRRPRPRVYARFALDAFLEHGLFFCSAGIEQDKGSSLPVKVLLFGFGFFTLISVSAYVANLAAFLTLSGGTTVTTMENAVKTGVTICAHPAVKAALQVDWPAANFYFHENGNEFPGLLDDYDAGKCKVLAVGEEDTSMDSHFLQELCNRELVYTRSMIVQIPVAFPIRSKLASGLSYWYMEAKKAGVTLEAAKEEFNDFKGCNVHLSEEAAGDNDEQISMWHMIFPILFFVVSAAIAVTLHLVHLHSVKKGNKSLVGRCSTVDQSLFLQDMSEGLDIDEEQDADISSKSNLKLESDDEKDEQPRVTFRVNNKTDVQGSKISKRRDGRNTIVRNMKRFTLDETDLENDTSSPIVEAELPTLRRSTDSDLINRPSCAKL